MITYLQRRGYHQKRSGSSRFNEESILRTEGMAHASGVTSGGVILSDLVNAVPLILYGLSIIGAGMHFSLPRADTPLSCVAPADTTHINLFFTLFGVFSFFDLFVI